MQNYTEFKNNVIEIKQNKSVIVSFIIQYLLCNKNNMKWQILYEQIKRIALIADKNHSARLGKSGTKKYKAQDDEREVVRASIREKVLI